MAEFTKVSNSVVSNDRDVSLQVQGNKVGCDFSPDGIKIVSGSADGSVYFYDLHTAKVTRKIPVCRGAVLPVAWHSVLPSVVACGSEDGSITVLQ